MEVFHVKLQRTIVLSLNMSNTSHTSWPVVSGCFLMLTIYTGHGVTVAHCSAADGCARAWSNYTERSALYPGSQAVRAGEKGSLQNLLYFDIFRTIGWRHYMQSSCREGKLFLSQSTRYISVSHCLKSILVPFI